MSLQTKLPESATVFDKDNGEYFEVFRKDGQFGQRQYAVDSRGKEVFRQSFPVAYVIGSGDHGFSAVVQRGDYLFEAPLSYYTKTHVWSFSPGYDRQNLAFTRPVLGECVSCHTGRSQPVPGRVALYRKPAFPELAIGCENCHGPGEKHVAAHRNGDVERHPDGTIVNPVRLTGWLADNICMRCHEGGDVRVTQPGKTEQDFRPGMLLDRVIAIFKVPLKREASEKPVLLEHYFSMTLSKCYRASAGRLRCSTCHDPHSQPRGDDAPAFYRAKCLGCHQPENCTLPAGERQRGDVADNCASCHMPKRTVTTIAHAALTDHMITVRPGQAYPDEATISHAFGDTGLLCLTREPGTSPSSIAPVTLLRAYMGLIHDGHQEFTDKKNKLLDTLARSEPANPVVLGALARRAAEADTPESLQGAIRYLDEAVRTGSTAPEDFLLLAQLYERQKRFDLALRALEKGRSLNPYFREFYEAVALQKMEIGKYADAAQTVNRGMDLFPDDVTLRVLEKKLKSAALDDALPQ